MKRFILFCLYTLPVYTVLLGQYPSLNAYTVSGISAIPFAYNGTHKGDNKAEIPPWILPGAAGDGTNSYFFVNNSHTYLWSSKTTLIVNTAIDLDQSDGPHPASLAYVQSSSFAAANLVQNWKRNYHGIYSAAAFHHPAHGSVMLGFLHGENKNVISDNGTRYPNTIQFNVPIDPSDPDSWSGGNPYHEGWDAYNGIISAAWTHMGATQPFFTNELGPIAWPSNGYTTTAGVKCTAGLRHPASIVEGDYVYVFFTDAGPYAINIPDEEGRHEGIKVIRASLDSALDPRSYRAFYKDSSGRDTWTPALPKGFTKENMLNFVSVKGPKTTDIMRDSGNVSQEIRFSAAKVRNTSFYIGVEQYIDRTDSQKYKVALRFSSDLVNWSERCLVVYTADNWNKSRMNYPIFLSNDGTSNTEIDIDDFYILGTGYTEADYVNRIHIQQSPSLSMSTLRVAAFPSPLDNTEKLFPNPTEGPCQLRYTLSDPLSEVKIVIYDMNGRQLQLLDQGRIPAGTYTRNIDIGSLQNGMYLIALYVNNRLGLYRVVKQ